MKKLYISNNFTVILYNIYKIKIEEVVISLHSKSSMYYLSKPILPPSSKW